MLAFLKSASISAKSLTIALILTISTMGLNTAHAEYWTIIGTGVTGDLDGKSFAVTLDTDKKEFIANGPSVDKFFVTKKGKYNISGMAELGTQLLKADNTEVAFFTNLVGTTAVGATGDGRASEKGEKFKWKLDSK